jgi:hypothetical protein
MHRDGSNPGGMQPADFICDFCLAAWDGSFPMVEGHRGSLICGRCLSVAYTDMVLGDAPEQGPEQTCVMCLEAKAEGMWQSPLREEAHVCRTCVNRSAGRLHKDPDWTWRKPTALQ